MGLHPAIVHLPFSLRACGVRRATRRNLSAYEIDALAADRPSKLVAWWQAAVNLPSRIIPERFGFHDYNIGIVRCLRRMM
jgi:hypothetical protein